MLMVQNLFDVEAVLTCWCTTLHILFCIYSLNGTRLFNVGSYEAKMSLHVYINTDRLTYIQTYMNVIISAHTHKKHI